MSKPSIPENKDSKPKPQTLGDRLTMPLPKLLREGGA